MIRGEILRTKTAQVSAEHQREASHLGALREREAKVGRGVRCREERFWREVYQASVVRGEARRAQGNNTSTAITRALEAHRLFKKAKDEHTQLAGEVRTQVSKVLKAKVALDAFSKMQRRERSQREYRRAERLGEEIAELQTFQKGHHGSSARLRGVPVREESSEVSVDATEAFSARLSGERQPSPGEWAPQMLSSPQAKLADSPVPVSNSLALRAVHAGTSEHGATLQVRIESSGTPIACHFGSTVSGEVGVVVEAARGQFVQRLERERAGIVSKLSELGIKISSFAVRRELGLGHSGGGFLRRGRRTQEERDENTIA